jgi:hypothetical protein
MNPAGCKIMYLHPAINSYFFQQKDPQLKGSKGVDATFLKRSADGLS